MANLSFLATSMRRPKRPPIVNSFARTQHQVEAKFNAPSVSVGTLFQPTLVLPNRDAD
jgi:hypothetical protein